MIRLSSCSSSICQTQSRNEETLRKKRKLEEKESKETLLVSRTMWNKAVVFADDPCDLSGPPSIF